MKLYECAVWVMPEGAEKPEFHGMYYIPALLPERAKAKVRRMLTAEDMPLREKRARVVVEARMFVGT